MPKKSYFLTTLGCPKNQVDSDKIGMKLEKDGYNQVKSPKNADLLVVNTCAFIDAAKEESINTILDLYDSKSNSAMLSVTGCLAERYGDELKTLIPEIDIVAGFNFNVDGSESGDGVSGDKVAVEIRKKNRRIPDFDLLNLPRPPIYASYAYVKVAEGCDRKCGFCAIPSFRGKQRSRTVRSILDEVEALDVQEVVLVAQDLASYGSDIGLKDGLITLIKEVKKRVSWVRLLYLYPSSLNERLVDEIVDTGVPYFDLSLQHASRNVLKAMKRYGSHELFIKKIEMIREKAQNASMRSSFMVGYPGESEDDFDVLVDFLKHAQLDFAGFFMFSSEDGTYASQLENGLDEDIVKERFREVSQIQDEITAKKRGDLIGKTLEVLIDSKGKSRSTFEAPEIDGIVKIPTNIGRQGEFAKVKIVDSIGPDLIGEAV